ncbi:GNAT family N-acetyltransferase [Nocardioides montaniterrae]
MAMVVRGVRAADEWRELRDLRLQALRDPIASKAFVATYDEEAAQPDRFWIDRAAGNAEGEASYQAIALDGDRLIGCVVGLRERAGDVDWAGVPVAHDGVLLVGVYVAPEGRGTGLLGRLVDDVHGWARSEGLGRSRLQVHAENPRAQAAYAKLGFAFTGETVEIASGVEREMARCL